MSIRENLLRLGIQESKDESNLQIDLPEKVTPLVMVYKHSVLFNDDIEFVPQYKTGLEGERNELSLDALWGLEDGDLNIFQANKSLEYLEAENCLFSIGESFGGNHICVSKDDGGVYLFVNDSEQNQYKIFDSLEIFTDSLKVNLVTDVKSVKATSVNLSF
ncbi:hypothetical protein LZS85_17450 [Aliivibrio fischeri]|uniref:SMI1/KNR4 family protein n=1 Tax=Aliivibrio fischeri TaxID=668 RepID=UPI001F3FD60E|nr:SMI1/KNR4 family protein [Aliivibrio fischeri]MCE7567916.1 hypothetical protein [Aliivibrio fischeri]